MYVRVCAENVFGSDKPLPARGYTRCDDTYWLDNTAKSGLLSPSTASKPAEST